MEKITVILQGDRFFAEKHPKTHCNTLIYKGKERVVGKSKYKGSPASETEMNHL